MVTKIVVRAFGGPEVLEVTNSDVGEPGPGEIRVSHTAIGLNYIDIYFRTGLYPSPMGLPFTPGLEAAGVIEAVGDGVTNVKVGQRVAYGTGPLGAYCGERVMPAAKFIGIPDSVADETAAAMMLNSTVS